MRKLLLLVHTLRYLTLRQLYFQVYYKLKSPFVRYIPYRKYSGRPFARLSWSCKELIVSSGKLSGQNQFTFLNRSHHFGKKVDWNFQGHGKLWNYNLQYFDYLHDAAIDDEIKQQLLNDFSAQLLHHTFAPEPYPVSLRIINWILYYADTGYASPVFLDALRYQVHYLESNLEYHILANHLLENLMALAVASIALNDKSLQATIFPKLISELQEQLFEDGGHYERSPMYHSIILSKMMVVYTLFVNSSTEVKYAGKIKLSIHTMFQWLSSFCFSTGSFSLVNDSTHHIAPSFATITKSAQQLGFPQQNGRLGQSGFRKYCGTNYELIVDAGNISPAYQPGHTHSGMLAFNLQVHGRDVIVDTGISTYENNATRAFERSTKAHNTVVVNNEDQFQVWSSFRVAKRAKVEILQEGDSHLSASHNGYRSNNIVHTRSFKAGQQQIEIKDILVQGAGKLAAGEAFIHFDYSVGEPTIVHNKIWVNKHLTVIFENPLAINILAYQQAITFNRFEQAFYVKISFVGTLTTLIEIS